MPIANKCNGTLEAAHVSIDDDRYDVAECGAAGRPRAQIGPLRSAMTLWSRFYVSYPSDQRYFHVICFSLLLL